MGEPRAILNDRRDNTPSPIVLRGTQSIHKFNRAAVDQVDILMALFRVQVDQKNADVVVSANIPKSSGSQTIIGEEIVTAIALDFDSLVLSLRIVDYGLFA